MLDHKVKDPTRNGDVWGTPSDPVAGKVRVKSPTLSAKTAKRMGHPPKSRVKSVLIFAMHQLIAHWGIAFFSAFALFSVFDWLGDFGWHLSLHPVHWILTQNPYYPVQIAVGLYLGWVLGRRFQHRSMLWVWILPLAILCYAFFATPILIPEWTSVLARPRTPVSRLSYYFGWGCQPTIHCLDQLMITMPFYSSVAYSLGARLARKYPKSKAAGELQTAQGEHR
jgi:hypothetical protein